MTNPIKLDRVLRAAGQSLIFNGRGNSVVDFGLALKDIRPDTIEMIKLPGGGVVGTAQAYRGERFLPEASRTSSPRCTTNNWTPFLLEHPEFRNKTEVGAVA